MIHMNPVFHPAANIPVYDTGGHTYYVVNMQ